ncbi:hypothetical protein CVV68_16750 [Arthrobacter livingstonensis]|uniref:Uncharacterized protein n=1 Tax=Arthrobacter livingstonensis TaxID=670078 RepID=A0A2V5L388_9MICC|nr:hypothetical protein [Arthrobacter livingstonensis]PYI65871.1 hypothetical protein CVV68_16750 [Arthrobacter livingstonensis]
MSTAFTEAAHVAALEQAVVNMHRSLEVLGAAAAALDVPVSPQMARGIQVTENAWRAMEQEFGLHAGSVVAKLLGSTARSMTGFANDRRNAGKLLGIRRRNVYLYPGFQFDRVTGAVLPVIPKLLLLADRLGVSHEGLALWLCDRTGQLHDDRPVDHLQEPDLILAATENHFGVEW